MLKKKDLDKLLTLTRKWYNEKDEELSHQYYIQAMSLANEIAKGTCFVVYEELEHNELFMKAWSIAGKRWTNEQFYIMIERAGEKVDGWEYQ